MSTIAPHVPVNEPTPAQVGRCGISSAELDAIVKAASDLFGTSVTPELEDDPESDESYYLLRVKVERDLDEVARLRKLWYEKLFTLWPDHCHFIRLAVDCSP